MASKQLTGLKPGTSYIVQVQAVGADSTQLSDWSTVYTFVTPGNPAGTTNTSQSVQIGKGASLFLGNPPMSSLVASNTNPGGQSGLVVNDNAFQALKADGSALFKLSVLNDSLYINATGFNLDTASAGNVLSIGTGGNTITMSASGNVTIGGTLTANSISLSNGDYWTSSGAFRLGGALGINYAGSGAISIGSNVSVSGDIISGGTIIGSNFRTSSSGVSVYINSVNDAIQFLNSAGTAIGNITASSDGFIDYLMLNVGTTPDATFTGTNPTIAIGYGAIDLYYNPSAIVTSPYVSINSLGVGIGPGSTGSTKLYGTVELMQSWPASDGSVGIRRVYMTTTSYSQGATAPASSAPGDLILVYTA
jgi:hypothetical protein